MHIKAVFDASRGWGGSGWEKFVPPGGQMTYPSGLEGRRKL